MYLLALIILTILLPFFAVSGGIKKGLYPYAVILQSILFMGFALVMLFGFSWSTGEPLGTSISKEFELAVDTIVKTPSLMNAMGLQGMGAAKATETLMKAYSLAINMIPSAIICWGLLFSYFYYSVISKIKKMRGKEVLMLPDFSNFSLPGKAVYGCLLIYVLSWITVSANIIPADVLLLNVQALIEFAFAAQGLAVVLYTTRQKKMFKIFRIVICFLLFASAFGRMFLAMFGFFDLLFGIRQKIENK